MKRHHYISNFTYARHYYRKKNSSTKFTKFYLLGIVVLCILIVLTESFLTSQKKHLYFNVDSNKTAEFREMKLSEVTLESILDFSKSNNIPVSRVITVLMIYQNFYLETLKINPITLSNYEDINKKIQKEDKEAYLLLLNTYEGIWEDVLYFPVPVSREDEKAVVTYEDSWMYERTFGGNRGHEGTDIMAGINMRGYYPIVSMTKGVVEQIGWLTQGGYRIGIRSEHGAYFYYAHLSEYSKEFKIGNSVEAGELLGFMGDTGYSDVEGTTGNFDVHLHVGIYINTRDNTSVSINPFWVLKYLENNKLYYSY